MAARELIRTFRREDVPDVLKVFKAAFLDSGQTTVPAEFETYFQRVFFESPWYDEDLPSFVHLDRRGSVIGFIGVQPRWLQLRGRRLRAAVSTKLMVSPTCGDPLAAVRLLGKVFAGPQDVLLSDLGNDVGRRVWEGLGGQTVLLYSLQWQRPLRPARHLVTWLGRRGLPRPVGIGLRPVCALTDALVGRLLVNRLYDAVAGYTAEDLPVETLVTRFPDLSSDRALRPEYDERGVRWLLSVAQKNEPRRVLRQRLVRDPGGAVVGWFIYFLRVGGDSEVLHVVAAPGAAGPVLQLLLADAWDQGAVLLTGRLEPRLMREMSLRHCYFGQKGPWMLVRSKHADVLEAILSGNAFLSRLEGEW